MIPWLVPLTVINIHAQDRLPLKHSTSVLLGEYTEGKAYSFYNLFSIVVIEEVNTYVRLTM